MDCFATQKPSVQLSSPPYVLHAQPINFFWILSLDKYLVERTDHEAPHYVVFSTLLSPRPPRSKCYPRHLSLERLHPVFLTQCERPSFTPIHNNRQNYSLHIVSLFFNQNITQKTTVELHLSGLIGTASQPDKQKIRIIRFFLENRLHWQFEFRLLLFTDIPASKPFEPPLIWRSRDHNNVQYLIWWLVISKQVSCIEFSTNLPQGPSLSG